MNTKKKQIIKSIFTEIVPSTSSRQSSKTDTGSELPVGFPRSQNGTRIVVLWTGIYFHGASDLDSEWNCSGNIKGACVMTTDKSKYKVRLVPITLHVIVKDLWRMVSQNLSGF